MHVEGENPQPTESLLRECHVNVKMRSCLLFITIIVAYCQNLTSYVHYVQLTSQTCYVWWRHGYVTI